MTEKQIALTNDTRTVPSDTPCHFHPETSAIEIDDATQFGYCADCLNIRDAVAFAPKIALHFLGKHNMPVYNFDPDRMNSLNPVLVDMQGERFAMWLEKLCGSNNSAAIAKFFEGAVRHFREVARMRSPRPVADVLKEF